MTESPATSGPTDHALLARARLGDGDAFDHLVRRYLRRVMAVAWEYTGTREDAEDVTQEAFRRVLENLDAFDLERPFRPWLFTIVRNTALNARARSSRLELVAVPEEIEAGAPDPLEDAAAAQLRGWLDRSLGRLSDMQRRCFRLRVLEDLSGAEVAEALGIGEETVRTHVFRARKILRSLMEKEGSRGWTA